MGGLIRVIIEHFKDMFNEDGLLRSCNKIRYYSHRNKYIEQESGKNSGGPPLAHVTYCVASNAGDTVLSQCVRRTISKKVKTTEWEIIPVLNDVTDKTIERINRCGLLVIGGGGLFLPDTNSNTVSGWQWAISSKQLKRISIPICVYSVGYNYFRGQETNKLFLQSIYDLVEKSSFIGLRNRGSIDAVCNLLPLELTTKIKYQPCTTTIIRKIYGNLSPKKNDTGSIAINMAFDRENLRFGNKKEVILNQVADAIKRIEQNGYRIYYVCHCWDDDKFLPYLKAKGVKYELVDLSYSFPEKVYNFYNEVDLVIGMRGHAQMIPFGLNCEIISLGTHDKMKWFLEDINALDWYVDISSDVNNISDNIYYKFSLIHEKKREETLSRLYNAQEKLWNITMSNLTKLEEIRHE